MNKESDSCIKILSIDIGGNNIKAAVLDSQGGMLVDYKKVPTPAFAGPEEVILAIQTLSPEYLSSDRVSVGFPGYVREGVVITAPNLGTDHWRGVDLATLLGAKLHRPVQVLNDADMHGLGIASGVGLEMVVTLGTGFGTAVLYNGKLIPHLELAHHPIDGEEDYDQYIGDKELELVGLVEWNVRLQKVIGILKTVFNYDRLYIGGGNSKKISFKLDDNIILANNREGIRGGAKLWK